MTRTTRDVQPPIRGDEPTKPRQSLPSYDEPTPETRRRITREEEAELALDNTRFSRGSRPLLIIYFLVTIVSVALVQTVFDFRRNDALTLTAPRKLLHRYALPAASEIKAVEKQIERASVISQWLLPHIQFYLTKYLRVGNEQVYVGREGWLFYRPDVEYVTGPPFLSPPYLRGRTIKSDAQPDPIAAILDFKRQLTSRGIELIVMAAPSKASVEPTMLAPHAIEPVDNASFSMWKQRLTENGVRVLDAVELLAARKRATGQSQYLATDSHWRPETMEHIAEKLAEFVGHKGTTGFNVNEHVISGRGDIAQMLKLSPEQQLFPTQNVTTHQVSLGNSLWRAEPASDVLLLGDSFTNIYSLDAMGWGEAAGLAEHLSRALAMPVDVIARNSDGAFATRDLLAHELLRGRDRLAGKKVVIWEFAARELAFGNWKLIEMRAGRSAPGTFFVPENGRAVEVNATIAAVSAVPQPGSVPYKDHVMSLHIVDVDGLTGSKASDALVYTWSMRENVWSPAARLRVGDRVRLRLHAWSEVSAEFGKFNRSELDDPAVQMEEPAWGELLH